MYIFVFKTSILRLFFCFVFVFVRIFSWVKRCSLGTPHVIGYNSSSGLETSFLLSEYLSGGELTLPSEKSKEADRRLLGEYLKTRPRKGRSRPEELLAAQGVPLLFSVLNWLQLWAMSFSTQQKALDGKAHLLFSSGVNLCLCIWASRSWTESDGTQVTLEDLVRVHTVCFYGPY